MDLEKGNLSVLKQFIEIELLLKSCCHFIFSVCCMSGFGGEETVLVCCIENLHSCGGLGFGFFSSLTE